MTNVIQIMFNNNQIMHTPDTEEEHLQTLYTLSSVCTHTTFLEFFFSLFKSVMYPLAKLDCNVETEPGSRKTSMNIAVNNLEEDVKQPSSASHRPKSIMVVHSTPSGDQIQCETYSIHVRI